MRGAWAACFLLIASMLSLPVAAQSRSEGAVPDGRGGVRVLTTGINHSCGIRNNGTVACWGDNHNGKATSPAGTFIELSAGFEHTCGLRSDGSVACWGAGFQQIEGEPPAPSQVPSGAFTALASGITYTCGLRASNEPWLYPAGNVECWRAESWGPPIPTPPAGDFIALTAGDEHVCGLRADGSAECWGNIDPAQPPPEGSFIALSAGARHTCGLRADGSVSCWGDSWAGQASPPAELFTAISAGGFHTCGLLTDGRVQCWGDNGGGQATPPEEKFSAISAGVHHTCGLRLEGRVVCWGYGANGGYGGSQVPLPVEEVFGVGQLSAGDWHHCQVTPEGRLSCWNAFNPDPAPWSRFTDVSSGRNASCGRNEEGRLACFGDSTELQQGLPFEPLRQFDLGYEHACAVLSLDGHAQCWGRDTNGQTSAPDGRFRNLSAGLVHSCGVSENGTGQCWGYDGDGQSNVPIQPEELRFLSVQAGERHSCGLRSDLRVKCWGLTPPLPYDPTHFDPAYHPDFATFRALSVGTDHSCAIRTDGRLLCWGANWSGQLQAPEGTFVAVSAGRNMSCAIRTDGTRECWGAPGMTPRLIMDPDRLPSARPGEWLHVVFQLRSESPYQVQDPRFTVVAGTLPLGLRLEPNGELRGAWHELGRYPITIEGRDRNGFAVRRDYVLSIDDTPPLIEPVITGTLGENGWYTSEVSLEWSVSDAGSDIVWSAGCNPASLGYEISDAGFFCHAESGGGSSFQEVHIKIDLMAPAPPLFDAIETLGLDARFEFAGADGMSGVAHYECSVDGGAFNACVSPLQLSVQSGPHDLQVRTVDAAGHRSEPTRHKWTTDPTPPIITSTVNGTLGLGGWYASAVDISWNVSDPDSAITSSTGCNPVTLSTSTPGASFTCTVTSAGGTSSETVTVKLDVNPPETTLTSTPAAVTQSGAAVFEFSGADATSGVYAYVCSLDGAIATICTSPKAYSVSPGHHTFTVRAYDAAGNRDFTPATYSWAVDQTPPVVSPTVTGTLGPNGWYVSTVKINWFVGDAESPFTSITGCGTVTLMNDSPGASFTCTATSGGGTTTKTVTIKADLTAPETTLISGPSLPINPKRAEFVFSGTDATSGVASYQCSLDGGSWSPCTSPWVVNVGAGNHSLLVMAIDAVDKNDPTPASHHWAVDGTPPSIVPTVSGTKNTVDWYNSDVQISWAVSDPESAIGSTSGCDALTLNTDTPMKSFTCTAESMGGSGNEAVYVRRDTTAPETTLTATPPAVDDQTQATFQFSGQDATSGVRHYECSVDGSAFFHCLPPLAHPVDAGSHTFRARAVDFADNRDPTPAEYSWVVDLTPPVITPIVSGPQGSGGWYVGDVQITWALDDPDSGITTAAGCNAATLDSDTSGTRFTCTATSTGGTVSRTVTIKRDATAPSIVAAAATAPNAAGWYNADVAVGFSCSDALSGLANACAPTQTMSAEGTSASSAVTVRDAAGNNAASNVVTVRIDRVAPILEPTVSPGPLLLNATASATANGIDSRSGIASEQCAPLVTGTVGSKAVTCTVTDAAGNSASAVANYRVAYGFVGFTSPVKNSPTLNVLKAGRSAPFRWRVIDANGAPVTHLGTAAIAATSIACPSANENRIYAYGGSNSQLQNLGDGYYQLDWLASLSLRGACRRLNLDLGDGEAHPTQFKFN